MDLVVLTSVAALVGVASGVLAFLVWIRQQVDEVRRENADDLRKARGEIHDQLHRELSAELRAELYKEILDAYTEGRLRDDSTRKSQAGTSQLDAESQAGRLSDAQ